MKLYCARQADGPNLDISERDRGPWSPCKPNVPRCWPWRKNGILPNLLFCHAGVVKSFAAHRRYSKYFTPIDFVGCNLCPGALIDQAHVVPLAHGPWWHRGFFAGGRVNRRLITRRRGQPQRIGISGLLAFVFQFEIPGPVDQMALRPSSVHVIHDCRCLPPSEMFIIQFAAQTSQNLSVAHDITGHGAGPRRPSMSLVTCQPGANTRPP